MSTSPATPSKQSHPPLPTPKTLPTHILAHPSPASKIVSSPANRINSQHSNLLQFSLINESMIWVLLLFYDRMGNWRYTSLNFLFPYFINISLLHMNRMLQIQNFFMSQLVQSDFAIAKLNELKKYIEQQLMRELRLNSYLHRLLHLKQNPTCKVESVCSQSPVEAVTLTCKRRVHERRHRKKQQIKKGKNDTKNIPKNYGKAIVTFVQQKQKILRRLMAKQEVSYDRFLDALREKKQSITSIAELRGLWLEESFEFAKQMRKVSMYFLKRGSLSYAFSSRIWNHKDYVKYRLRLIEVLRCPSEFTYLKAN